VVTPHLVRYGKNEVPVVTLDEFSGDIGATIDLAASVAPFPASTGTYYPGVRQIIAGNDGPGYNYVRQLLDAASPYIGGAFDMDRFDLIEASFSLVTCPPHLLEPAQRTPHFDSTDPDYLAVIHYLSTVPKSGTAFYRQRSTGIECVTDENAGAFINNAQHEAAFMTGYTNASNEHFEQIGKIDCIADRLVIYPGQLLHSGIIPDNMDFSSDPRCGRLTTNIFIKGYRDKI
jgi:hypothetical protein